MLVYVLLFVYDSCSLYGCFRFQSTWFAFIADIISMQIITTKLNGSNDLLWAQAMKVALGGRKNLKYIESNPLSKDSKDYEDWVSDNYLVMSWLWNSMDPTISSSVMFLSTAKAIWVSVPKSFSIEKNVSRVYEVYQNLFLLQ